MIYFILISFFLFILGIYGMFLVRKHIIIILISLELLLLSANLNFMIFSIYLDDFLGQIYILLILTIAAAETSLGLALLIVFFRIRGGISIDLISLLKS